MFELNELPAEELMKQLAVDTTCQRIYYSTCPSIRPSLPILRTQKIHSNVMFAGTGAY